MSDHRGEKKKRTIVDVAESDKPSDKAKASEAAKSDGDASKTVWDQAEFADDDRKRKFMRLMGAAKKPAAETVQQGDSAAKQSATDAGKEKKFGYDPSKLNADLERDFMSGMSRQLSQNRRACFGFSQEGDKSAASSNAEEQSGSSSKAASKPVERGSHIKFKNDDDSEVEEAEERVASEREQRDESNKHEKYAQFQFSYSNQQNSYGGAARGRGSFQNRSDHSRGSQRGRLGFGYQK